MYRIKPTGSGETTEASSTKSETPSTKTGGHPPATGPEAANQQYLKAPMSFLTPSFGSTSASQANSVGESSSDDSQSDIQKMLTPGYWGQRYKEKYEEAKASGANKPSGTNKASGANKASGTNSENLTWGRLNNYADLQSTPKGQKDYWKAYPTKDSKNTEARTSKEVDDLKSEIDTILKEHENEPSLVVYKSQPKGREKTEGHLGDYNQAKSYYDRDPNNQVLTAYTLKPGAQHVLFNPKYMALSPQGKQHRTLAELAKLNGGQAYPLGDKAEGNLPGYIGLKAEGENRGQVPRFSLGIGKSGASLNLFEHLLLKQENGQPGKNGWEPIPKEG